MVNQEVLSHIINCASCLYTFVNYAVCQDWTVKSRVRLGQDSRVKIWNDSAQNRKSSPTIRVFTERKGTESLNGCCAILPKRGLASAKDRGLRRHNKKNRQCDVEITWQKEE